jgi:hypothetical protein
MTKTEEPLIRAKDQSGCPPGMMRVTQRVFVTDVEATAQIKADAAREREAKQFSVGEDVKAHAWRTQHECHIRGLAAALSFGVHPNFWGCESEVTAWARERSLEMNLPLIMVGQLNPDLKSRIFESPGVYVIAIRWDEFENVGGVSRVHRY